MGKKKREIDFESVKNDLLLAILQMNWTDGLKHDVIKEVWNRE